MYGTFSAVAVTGWHEVQRSPKIPSQCHFAAHYDFDKDPAMLVVLDLPPASSWSRARHWGEEQGHYAQELNLLVCQACHQSIKEERMTRTRFCGIVVCRTNSELHNGQREPLRDVPRRFRSSLHHLTVIAAGHG